MAEYSNMAASVHQRLLNKARETSRPFNELLQHYACERFIYRLSRSSHADRFLLKGALLFAAWVGPVSRPTMDIDLLGRISNSPEAIAEIMRDVCETAVEDDGLAFHGETVAAARIAEIAEYGGVRVRFRGNLGNAKLSLQVDIGFGDVIIPRPQRIEYPALLEFPAPALRGYTMESTIAEKYHAMARLGALNSRMKDFYDIWMLSSNFDFKGEVLTRAIKKTFGRRGTPITAAPTVFDAAFAKDSEKNIQWLAFIRKSAIEGAPGDFEEAASGVKAFLEPLVATLAEAKPFSKEWKAAGHWK